MQHPLHARFGHSRRFGQILRGSGLLLPDAHYELGLLRRCLALAPPPALADRLELRARLVLFDAPPDPSPAARADIEAGQAQLVELARASSTPEYTLTMAATRAQLHDALFWLRPRADDATPADLFVGKAFEMAPACSHRVAREMYALKARARPLTLTELALLEDEFPPSPRPEPDTPSTPSPRGRWRVNRVFELSPVGPDPAPEAYDEAVPMPDLDDPVDLPLPVMAEDQEEEEARGEKRPRAEAEAEPEPAPAPKRARLRGQHRTPTKPTCTFVDPATQQACLRQVRKPGAARCSQHCLREAPPTGAYCTV
jgi:hypothetical protein